MPIPEKRTLASPGHRPSGLGPRAPTPARRPLPSMDSLTGALSTSPLPEPGSHLRHSQNRSSSSRTAPTRCQGGACAETARRLALISVASVSGSVWFGSTQAESAPPPETLGLEKHPWGWPGRGPSQSLASASVLCGALSERPGVGGGGPAPSGSILGVGCSWWGVRGPGQVPVRPSVRPSVCLSGGPSLLPVPG